VEAVKVAAEERPDVILMDLSMPNMDGIEATRLITAENPEACVLVLTSFSDRDRVFDALQAGAVGYLLKDSDHDELLRGIRAAAAGGSPLDPRVAREVLRVGSRLSPGAVANLTERELEVLRLVAEGLANKQIASRLGITERTVKAHLGSAFQRIGVGDRTSAALWAQRNLSAEPG
jgi:DNA-binding NarL/FixJ family response regulator